VARAAVEDEATGVLESARAAAVCAPPGEATKRNAIKETSAVFLALIGVI